MAKQGVLWLCVCPKALCLVIPDNQTYAGTPIEAGAKFGATANQVRAIEPDPLNCRDCMRYYCEEMLRT